MRYRFQLAAHLLVLPVAAVISATAAERGPRISVYHGR
jgi:hypothetical protein